MSRFYTLSLLCIMLGNICQGQTKETKRIEKKNSNNQYTSFVLYGNDIWALTTNGKISVFNDDNGDVGNRIPINDSAIIILAKDREGNIIIGDQSKSIKKYDSITNSWIVMSKYANHLLGITFDSKNNYYLITNKGIYDPVVKKYFYPDSSLNHSIRHDSWFRNPVYMTDKNDNLWIGFGYGEWGGDLYIFNTIAKKFIAPKFRSTNIELNPVKSIFQGKDKIFITTGLMHFSLSGTILAFSDFVSSIIFESSERLKDSADDGKDGIARAEYIGPGAFNEKDSTIYFYSQNGIFKGNLSHDLSKLQNWEKILQPKLHWTDGQPDAIGSPMNVFKLEFSKSGKLIFVSQLDGIGIYDGETLLMIQ